MLTFGDSTVGLKALQILVLQVVVINSRVLTSLISKLAAVQDFFSVILLVTTIFKTNFRKFQLLYSQNSHKMRILFVFLAKIELSYD